MEFFTHDLLQANYGHTKIKDLPVYLVPKPGFLKKYVILGVDYGSIDLDYEWRGQRNTLPPGTAHFLEHQLFEQQTGENAFAKFAGQSAAANAYTSHTTTAYLFSCTDQFAQNLGLLLDFVYHPYFTEESVTKEIGVISEEIDMGDDDPGWKVYHNLLQNMFAHHPLREEIAGTRETIREITADTLYRAHSTYYRPANMALVAVGDIDPQELEDLVAQGVPDSGGNGSGDLVRHWPEEKEQVVQSQSREQLDVTQSYFLLGFKEIHPTPEKGRPLVRRDMVTSLALELLLGRSTRTYSNLYDTQLIDGGFSYYYNSHPHFGYTLIGGETRDPEQLESRLMERLEGDDKLLEEDFLRIKNKAMGRALARMDSLNYLGNEFLDGAFIDFPPFDSLQLLDEITLDEIEDRWKNHFRRDNRSVSIVEPQGS